MRLSRQAQLLHLVSAYISDKPTRRPPIEIAVGRGLLSTQLSARY